MTGAVRALLTPFYWLAVALLWLMAMPWPLALLAARLPWWGMYPACAALGVGYGAAAVYARGPLLNPPARYLAGLIEDLAAEWHKVTAAPTLPPSGGTPTDGPAGPDPERIHP